MNHNFLILPLLLLFICTTCDDNRHIRYYQIEKEKTTPEISIKETSTPSAINWTTPSNWISSEGSSMRIGSFDVPYSSGKGDLSVIKLGGTAGGLTPNINRWRGQLDLKPHTEDEIQEYIQIDKSPLGSFQWLTIINPENAETAFIASIFQTQAHTIFIKLSASKTGISELETQFLHFCKSFTLDTAQ